MLDLEILPSGAIRFRRQDNATNDEMMEFLSSIMDVNEIKEFLDGGQCIQVLFGEESLCG